MKKEDLQKYSYEYLLNNAMEQVPETVDKREGSIIYDAIAPAAYLLAGMYMDLAKVYDQTFAETASGENLDKRVFEQGLVREKESQAVRLGKFLNIKDEPMLITIGSKFSTKTDENFVVYEVVDQYKDTEGTLKEGFYRLRCETFGTIGNAYYGEILPLDYLQGLKSATILDILVPAQDTESDEDLRQRYFQRLTNKSFGGNVAQYREELRKVDGVGGVQVYPVWNGGGTVLLCVVDAELNPITQAFIDELKVYVDPYNNGAEGKGYGIAPIGHLVTIKTPEVVNLTIDVTLELSRTYTLEEVSPAISKAINDYILSVTRAWGTSNEENKYISIIYKSRILSSVLLVDGVSNVTRVTINGVEADLVLTNDTTKQELPKFKEVILHEVD